MSKCSFCAKTIEPGTGVLFVTKVGKMLYFCSSKCRKNLNKLNRNPAKFKWTGFYKKEK
ncbi:50S ribosomal protein L24e [Candidatus Woesearchaeota archaeon]|nr:50S ribosomal protein L24e [Candidatus Woesearchaeota archaeon]